ncbi:hypothetical protein HMPREF1870_00107 [Bacteroidales bacterium KA00344]|nr:hypothetical protein HMPREF1870_00107 [Bacteroidales bacterium KA00344]
MPVKAIAFSFIEYDIDDELPVCRKESAGPIRMMSGQHRGKCVNLCTDNVRERCGDTQCKSMEKIIDWL